MKNVQQHVFNLARYTHHSLRSFRHGNGAPVVEAYPKGAYWDVRTQGSIVNFSILKSDGTYVGYSQVGNRADMNWYQVNALYTDNMHLDLVRSNLFKKTKKHIYSNKKIILTCVVKLEWVLVSLSDGESISVTILCWCETMINMRQ